MEIRTEAGTIVEVEAGAFVYDELSNTYTTWDELDTDTQQNLESLTAKIGTFTESLSQTIKGNKGEIRA